MALILILITLTLPVHTTISSQSNKSRTATRVYFNVKHIPPWVMILSLGKSFFRFLLTESTILELLPSVVTILLCCLCCDQSIQPTDQSLSYILTLILVIYFWGFHRLSLLIWLSDTWKPSVFGGAPSDQAAINHGTYFYWASQEGLINNGTSIASRLY